MRTQVTYTTLILIFALISVNVSAGGKKIIKEKEANINSVVKPVDFPILEEPLELESWMISIKEFNAGTENFVEENLQFEPWMLKSFHTENNSDKVYDQEMMLEPWMMKRFEVISDESFQDEELNFEPWMFKF